MPTISPNNVLVLHLHHYHVYPKTPTFKLFGFEVFGAGVKRTMIFFSSVS
jgi:hypothetical protein